MTDSGTTTQYSGRVHARRLLVLEDVSKSFGDLRVLRDVNLSLDRREVLVIVGPSGGGKSPLCRTVNRLEPIDSGCILFDGRPLPVEGRGSPAGGCGHGVPVVQSVRPQDVVRWSPSPR